MTPGLSSLDPPTQPDDAELIRLVIDAQPVALGHLYDRYGRLVFSLAFQVIGDSAAAEEITQEVFLQVWNKASTYQPDQGKVVTWLISVARHRAIDALRRKGARPEGHAADLDGDNENELVDPAGVEDQVMHSQRSLAVRKAIASLPHDQRLALSMAYFKGMTHQEVADAIGEPLGTIKTRIRLAMIKLRQLLEEENQASTK
jgi:RNA polymerase sigma-70 factor (ECF subfamily)